MKMIRLLGASVVVALVMAACGSDDDPPPRGQGGKGGSAGKGGTSGTSGKGGTSGTAGTAGKGGTSGTGTDGGAGTAGSGGSAGTDGGDGGQTKQQRGEYLVKHVGACPDCHTPRKSDGSPDTTKFLAGNPTFADIAPGDDAGTLGMVPSRNITPDNATGIGSWTDAEIKAAFLDGISKRTPGVPLFPVMPYYVLHNMSAEDADAIVAYLRTVPAINNAIPARQDLGFPFTQAAQPVPVASIPNTTLPATDANYARAQNGKYLAGHIGVCMECHTKEAQAAVPIDTTKLFQGNRGFPAVEFGLPVPPFPGVILSRNLTPHANGIQGWTAQAVADALRLGVDKDGVPLCPPMPAGPGQAFGGLTASDALDIGHYLTTLPPQDNGVIPNCSPPAPPDGGGDASTDARTD